MGIFFLSGNPPPGNQDIDRALSSRISLANPRIPMTRRVVPNDLSFGQLFLLQEINAREVPHFRLRSKKWEAWRKKLLRHAELKAAAVLGLVLGLAASVLFLSFQPSGLVEAGKTAPLAPPQAAIAASASR